MHHTSTPETNVAVQACRLRPRTPQVWWAGFITRRRCASFVSSVTDIQCYRRIVFTRTVLLSYTVLQTDSVAVVTEAESERGGALLLP